MSSKNPFRKSIAAKPSNASTENQQPSSSKDSTSQHEIGVESTEYLATQAPEQRRTSKTKRVRIQTPPPLSPESTRSSVVLEERDVETSSKTEPEGRFLGSIPQELLTDDSMTPLSEDPFAMKNEPDSTATRLSETADSDRLSLAWNGSPQPPVSLTSTIANPFQRTLATMEPSNPVLKSQQEELLNRPHAVTESMQRPPMDVDSFKRLLLTGKSDAPSDPSLQPATTPTHMNEMSRTGALPVDSPTSTPRFGSTALPDQSHLTPGQSTAPPLESHMTPSDPLKATRRPAPPPPKPRHGKLIAQQQTTPSQPQMTSQPPRNLPSAPLALSTNLPTYDFRDSAPRNQEPQLPQSFQPVETKLTTPTPPLSRRASTQTASVRQLSSPSSLNAPKPPIEQTRAPRPPPARRSAPSASALANAASPARKASDSSTHSTSESVVPAGRPRSSSHSSSIASARASAPPPPPSRRRASSRSSVDAPIQLDERPSARSSAEKSRAPEEASVAPDRDNDGFSAGLDALQAEIDGLQNKSGRGL